MHPATHLGLGEWAPSRAAMVTALGLWTAGFALAGASAWRMHRAVVANWDNSASSSAAPSEAPTEAVEQDGVVYMPEDVIVAGTPARGVTMAQNP